MLAEADDEESPSLSCGVATAVPGAAEPSQLLAAADAALYLAKHRGGNRVCTTAQVAEEGEAEPESPAPVIVVTEATGDAHGHGATGDEAAADDHAVTAEDTAATAPPSDSDTIARILGIGGLVVGVIGIVLALAARRPRSGA